MKTLSSSEVLHGEEDKFTVALLHEDGSTTRLLKVIYSTRDCSYFVSFPYHPYKGTAVLGKYTVNYARQKFEVSHEEMHDIASSDDQLNAIKLSHHPDGLIQFSGGGIISGPNSNGLKVRSWPLSKPTPGPAFGVSIFSTEGYSTKKISDVACTFPARDLLPNKEKGLLVVEGFYFPRDATNHTQRTHDGERVITIRRPLDGKALQLKVLTPPAKCWELGFVALHAFLEPVSVDQKMQGLIVGTATGNIRKNASGELLGDTLFLAYPKIFASRRNIDFTAGE